MKVDLLRKKSLAVCVGGGGLQLQCANWVDKFLAAADLGALLFMKKNDAD